MPRPYLVFVRAGNESLHRRLIAEDPGRNWDCAVSWYVAPPPEQVAEYYCQGGFNKFDGFLEFWRQRPPDFDYRYLLLLDDDVYLAPGDVSRFLALCEHYHTYLAQPALHWFTQTTMKALVRNPACVLRRVSYVEVMAPCFSSAALAQLLHTFGMTRSTWGTDVAWAGVIDGRQPIYVVDAVGMDHTRTGDGRPAPSIASSRKWGWIRTRSCATCSSYTRQLRASRTLSKGHVFRAGIPAALAPALMWLFERLKFIVRLRKRALFHLRYWRASLEDAFTR